MTGETKIFRIPYMQHSTLKLEKGLQELLNFF